ncbi:SDR family oxidoreductase [Ornithinibacillus sp. BX22]|uniref:SDR family oxidoreductase n=1 Tax=Ornithinibacillus hominis TaxID=2763055 RepID=A0A923L759_9BACI|nr:SDR family oxidoreductase [Ornithinibacillus hominis]MBC5637755.1 SDR family oxidoreductase [Ornithinibacillus hominis]
MDLGLKGKSVIVMAASKGLGKATALQFAQEGAHVIISSRHESDLKAAVSEIQEFTSNNHVSYKTCDVTNPADIKELVQFAIESNGKIDVLVNNAGGPPAGGFEHFDDEAWQNAFELNLLSYIRAIREVLPYMKQQRSGHIINFTSSSIKQTLDNLILSNTFRAGVVGLAKSLSQELAQDNILINTLGPGRIATERVEHLDTVRAEQLGVTYDEVKSSTEKSIPIGRYGNPEEFAKQAVFLCSAANTYVTGQTLLVDGGLVKAL